MTRADFRRGPESYRRSAPTKAPRKTFLIVTEGKKTEPNYLRSLCRKLNLSTAEVFVYRPEATDPKSLTDEAIELSKVRKRMARKSQVVPYDEVRVVYDLEKPHDVVRVALAAHARLRAVTQQICALTRQLRALML